MIKKILTEYMDIIIFFVMVLMFIMLFLTAIYASRIPIKKAPSDEWYINKVCARAGCEVENITSKCVDYCYKEAMKEENH